MNVAITGGTGFVGTHLARRLVDDDHEVVLVARGTGDREPDVLDSDAATFAAASVTDASALRDAFADSDAVAHLAGVNVERGDQTFEAVHVEGTRNVVDAATDAGAVRFALTSFLKARPDCGSAYHESKWAAEEAVRESDLAATVLKPGVVYGRGDHLLSHLSRALATARLFPSVGLGERRLRPLAVADLVDVLVAALTGDRLADATVAAVGPEALTLTDLVRRVGDVLGRRPLTVPLPVRAHYALARVQERVLATPVVARAQVRILAEGACEPAPAGVCEPLPDDLAPTRPFSAAQVERGLSELRRYGLADLRW